MYQCWQFSFFPSTLASIESSPRNWEMNLAFFHYKFSQLPIIFKWNDAPSLFDLAILAYFLSFFHNYTSYFFGKLTLAYFAIKNSLISSGKTDMYLYFLYIFIDELTGSAAISWAFFRFSFSFCNIIFSFWLHLDYEMIALFRFLLWIAYMYYFVIRTKIVISAR